MLKSEIKKGDYIRFEYPNEGILEARVIRINAKTVTASLNKIERGGVPTYRIPFRLVMPSPN
jgi:hypothetical protein